MGKLTYTTSEIQSLLDTVNDGSADNLDNYYNKEEVDSLADGKQDTLDHYTEASSTATMRSGSGMVTVSSSDNGEVYAQGEQILLFDSTTSSQVLINGDIDVTTSTGNTFNYNGEEVAVKSDIPENVSELNNDSGYVTSSALSGYATTAEVETKQDVLTAGNNIAIENDVISATGLATTTQLATKQDALEYYTETPSSGAASLSIADASASVTISARYNTTRFNGGRIVLDATATNSVAVTTSTSKTFTYNGSEVATESSVSSAITTAIAEKQDALEYWGEDTDNHTATISADVIMNDKNIGSGVDDFWYIHVSSDGSIYYGEKGTTNLNREIATLEDINTAVSAVQMNIVSVDSSSVTTLSAAAGNCYVFSGEVSSLAVTLPTIVGASTLKFVEFMFTTASTTSVSFAPSASIYAAEDFAIEASGTYEINAMWNGSYWTLAQIKATASS